MGSLTVTYERGRFPIGGRRISMEIDGVPEGRIEGGESRTFHMPDGKHVIVFRCSFSSLKVDLTLSGDDSFTVFWDRANGGVGISEDGGLDRSSWGTFAVIVAVAVLGSIIYALRAGKVIPASYALAGIIILMIILLLTIHIDRNRSRTVVWGGKEE